MERKDGTEDRFYRRKYLNRAGEKEETYIWNSF